FALRAVSQGRVVQDRVHVALRMFHSLSKKSSPSRERPPCLGATLCSSTARRHAASCRTRDSDGHHHDTFSASSSTAATLAGGALAGGGSGATLRNRGRARCQAASRSRARGLNVLARCCSTRV